MKIRFESVVDGNNFKTSSVYSDSIRRLGPWAALGARENHGRRCGASPGFLIQGFLGQPYIVDLWGPGGPDRPQNHV